MNGGATRRWGWRGAGIGIAVLAVGWLLVPLITLRGAQARILAAIQAGLGRQLSADTVRLRLLPLPGVELDGVRLAEDPAFGAEPMVFADDATAAVRILPLFAGRIEFARIHLDNPSINLVRNRAGRWNVAALLERAHQLQAGNHARTLPAAPFPYLDWSDARINFKLEQTKTRLYLDQVQGSLVHDARGWQLHASFVPERTDLNLSDTGTVSLDGRWPDAPGDFRQRPFAVEVRLSNSYLAGSTALVAGHDAGVHGVLAAQLHITPAPGTAGAGFLITGTAQAQALRRWDLMPPAVSMSADFAGVYLPDQDRFELTGAGDSGWQHLRVSGAVSNVFSGLSVDLHAAFHDFPAADLIPVALALKSNVPADLHALGTVNGSADLAWSPWGAQASPPQAAAQLTLANLVLSSGSQQLLVPAAQLTGRASRLRLVAAPASILSAPAQAAVPIELSGRVDTQGFEFLMSAPSLTPMASQSVCRLFGLASPWPSAIAGRAQVHLALDGIWAQLRKVGWTGVATLEHARFQPAGGPGLELEHVRLQWAHPAPAQLALTVNWPGAGARAAGDGMALSLQAPPTAASPWRFSAHAARLDSGAVWRWLQPPPPGDLLQRVFGTAPSGWSAHVQASGSVAIADLEWQGRHAAVHLDLNGAGGRWQAPRLQIGLAGGTFAGQGELQRGQYQIQGAVAAAQAMDLAALLNGTPYQDWIEGTVTGSVSLTRPAGDPGWGQVAAAGDFTVRDGRLATTDGWQRFQRFSAHYQLGAGVVRLSDVQWLAAGQHWRGQGSAQLDAVVPELTLTLHRAGEKQPLTVQAAPMPPHAQSESRRERRR